MKFNIIKKFKDSCTHFLKDIWRNYENEVMSAMIFFIVLIFASFIVMGTIEENKKRKFKEVDKKELAIRTFMKANSDKNITYEEAKNYIEYIRRN